MAVKFGLKSENCQTTCTKKDCYIPCEHTNNVLSKISWVGFQDTLSAVISSMTRQSEKVIEKICNYEPDLCQIGNLLAFPPVQCIVDQKGFSLCPTKKIKCIKSGNICDHLPDDICGFCSPNQIRCSGYEVTTINPCFEICAEACLTDCTKIEYDYCVTEEGLALYEKMINAIKGKYTANWAGIESAAKNIFPNAEIITKRDGIFYIAPNQELTELEEKSLLNIKSVLPVPIGTSIEFVS